MKLYTNTFDLAYPSVCRFWVAPNSDFKIGIKIENKGASYEGDFVLKQNGEVMTADESKVAGFTTYTIKSLGTGSVIYTVEAADAQQKFTLVQIVTDSTVFEVGALSGGGDVPADVATQSWVNSQISDFITEDDLTSYATKDDISAKADVSSLTAYAEVTSLTSYATKDELTAKADVSSLTAYAQQDDLTAYAEVTSLTAYATKDELTAKADVSSLTAYATTGDLSNVSLSAQEALSTAIDINDVQIPNIQTSVAMCVQHQADGEAPEIFQIQSVYETAWETISADADINTFYVVLPDPVTP